MTACQPTTTIVDGAPAPGSTPTTVETVAVSRVDDGDTVHLEDGRTVRLVGINAPEADECFGDDAKAALANLVEGREVGMGFDVEPRDQFDRLLALLVVDGSLVNLRMVADGYALAISVRPRAGLEQRRRHRLPDRRRRALCGLPLLFGVRLIGPPFERSNMALSDNVKKLLGKAKEAAGDLAEKAQPMMEKAKEAAGDLAEKAQPMLEKAKGAASEAWDKIEDKIEDMRGEGDKVKDAAEEAVEQAKTTVPEAGDKAAEAVAKAKDTAGEG
jgi:uncharacterized protein YjbJ (UPF0337 family)